MHFINQYELPLGPERRALVQLLFSGVSSGLHVVLMLGLLSSMGTWAEDPARCQGGDIPGLSHFGDPIGHLSS